MVELASKLGHNAFLADGHRAEVAGLSGPIRLELDLALKKIYGQPLPGEDVDVEARNLLSAQTSDFTSS